MSATLLAWAKALHILSFTAWMAGIFYLPRLFVYHTRLAPGSDAYLMFSEMERKLLKIIMVPAAISTWLFGLMIAHVYFLGGNAPAWLILKICCVIGLTAFQYSCARHADGFAGGAAPKSERFYRMFNEIPTLFLGASVLLAVFKPTVFGL